jgi:hypothetical protein
MRNAVGSQRLEHGGVRQNRHGAAAGKGELWRPIEAMHEPAHAARGKRQQHQSGIGRKPDERHVPHLRGRLRRCMRRALDACEHGGIALDLAPHLITAGDVTRDRQRRDQNGERAEHRNPAPVPALGAQPEVNSDGGVSPHRQHRGHLQRRLPRRDQPMPGQHRGVTAGGAEKAVG